MLDYLKKILSGMDNSTPDIGRYSWLICTFSVLGAAFGNWYSKGMVDLSQLGIALSGVAAAHGIAIGAKSHSEPK